MMDGQTNTWNEWANYVLHVIKKHDGNFEEIEEELKRACLLIQNKLDKETFQNFRADDYNIFKTEILTKAQVFGIIWGIIAGGIVSFIVSLLT